jgi:hypothetical protein
MSTAYGTGYGLPFAGQISPSSGVRVEAWVNGQGADVPAGVAVAKTATENSAALPAASTDVVAGFIVNSFARNPTALTTGKAVIAGDEMNVLSEGAIYVDVEQTMTVADPVYVRYSANGGSTQLGKVRKDADGVAEVHTVTPTAVNSQVYVLRVTVGGVPYTFEYQADGSATATEIVTGFKTAMAADAAFTALVVATGTTTLILTGQVAGQAFTVLQVGDGVLADVTTTPAAAHAARCKGARVLKGGSSTVPALIYFSASAEAAQH